MIQTPGVVFPKSKLKTIVWMVLSFVIGFMVSFILLIFFSEFVSSVRNLMRCIPLVPNFPVSDGEDVFGGELEILEYLASFNYDTKSAWFNLTCNLSCGKGIVFLFSKFVLL
jgi:hypothetical protein